MDRKIDQLKNQLIAGGITRRQFAQQLMALGIAGSSAGTLLTWAGQAHAAAPKRGGRFRQGLSGANTTDVLDPGTFADAYLQNLGFGQLRNCLVEVDHDGRAVPELAESLEATPDAKVWRVKLRQGVEFHNGKTLTAADVIYSLNHHRGENTKSAAKSVVKPIQEMKADGKYTVVFTLEGGNADFPYVVSDYHLGIVPEGNNFMDGVGTGGYSLVSFDPGVRALTKRNPNYWKEGKAHFDEVETLAINDTNARMNALATGEVDYIIRCDVKTVHLLGRNPNINIVETTGYKHYTIPMRTDTAPFDDNNVRMALKHAVDREAMVKIILRGHGAVGNDHPISPANQFHASELPQRRYDPDKAKSYLKKAGLSSLKVQLSAADAAFVGAVDAAVLYSEQASKSGISIEVVRESSDGYWSDVWMKKPWSMVFWSGRPTEDWMFTIAYAAESAWNDTFWKPKRFNELLKAGRAELDSKKRRAIYVEMQQILRDDGGVVIPMFANNVDAASIKLANDGNVAGNWEGDGHKNTERWWFA